MFTMLTACPVATHTSPKASSPHETELFHRSSWALLPSQMTKQARLCNREMAGHILHKGEDRVARLQS